MEIVMDCFCIQWLFILKGPVEPEPISVHWLSAFSLHGNLLYKLIDGSFY